MTLDSCLWACGNSLEHPPLNVSRPLGHRDGDGKLLPWGLNRITHQTDDLHVTQLLTGAGPPFCHFQGYLLVHLVTESANDLDLDDLDLTPLLSHDDDN